MTTRWCKKAPRIAFIVFIIVSLIIGTSILVALVNGAFSRSDSENNFKTPPNSSLLGSSTLELNYVTTTAATVTSNDKSTDTHRNALNNVRKTPPSPSISSSDATNNRKFSLDDDLLVQDPNGLNNVEYIKLKKVLLQPHDTDVVQYEPTNIDSSELETDNSKRDDVTGHFRHKTTEIWDPHPQYELEAFGNKLHLNLYHDDKHVRPDLTVTHVWENQTLRRKQDHQDHDQLRNCFYKGHVAGDDNSAVAVSLCGGMKGTIKSSHGVFTIRPLEEYTNKKVNILHAIHRLPSRSKSNSAIDGEETLPCDLEAILDSDLYNETQSGHTTTTDSPTMMDDVIEAHSRNKRSASTLGKPINHEYTIEVLVAVDKKMQEQHGENLKEYVLTLMSTVSSIYADESIGNIIHVAVVHIVNLNDDLVVRHSFSEGRGVSASAMLVDFCRLKEKYSFRHDTAILLTREQICRSPNQTKCDTLGLAELGTMCKPKSCAIIQDNGLSAAFTIAHELGHVLNMPHDDDPRCQRETGEDRRDSQSKQHIMSRMLDQNTNPWSWSKCSRRFVTEYLEQNNALCLENKPDHNNLLTPENNFLAGEKFTDNQQCELSLGAGSKICSYMKNDICKKLWCTHGDLSETEAGCATHHMPWADGTECGEGKWCQRGECIAKDRQARPVDGGWGPWSAWTECSLTCGGGIQFSTRECDNPKPSNGGEFCHGSRTQYRSCNTEECPPGELGIREKQCASFDGRNHGHDEFKKPKWVPKYGIVDYNRDGRDQCKLYCQIVNSHYYFDLAPRVIDGTPCTHDGFDKCVRGQCMQTGCDYVIGSGKTLDRCGVCGGNNDTCKDVRVGVRYDELYKYQHGRHYYNITTIPQGAANIVITQPGCNADGLHISLSDNKGKQFINAINGPSSLQQHRKKFTYAGVTFDYSGLSSSYEEIRSTSFRKLQLPLVLGILNLQTSYRKCDNHHPHILTYSYSISDRDFSRHRSMEQSQSQQQRNENQQNSHPQPQQPPQQQIPHYTWKMSNWSQCDQLCNGRQNRTANCYDFNSAMMVPNHLAAKYCTRTAKPSTEYKYCNKDCVLEWDTNKSECSEACGEGWRQVQATCVRKDINTNLYSKVDHSYCRQDTKPPIREKCQGDCKDVTWGYGEWGPCSVTCGEGTQQRETSCLEYAGGKIIEDKYCQGLAKQETVRSCNAGACAKWVHADAGQCSVTCGEGKRVIRIQCQMNNKTVDSKLCSEYPRPVVSIVDCVMPPCENKVEMYEDLQVTTPRHFTYTVLQPRKNPNTYHPTMSNEIDDIRYEWRTGSWGDCSVACEGGQKARIVKCQLRSSLKTEYVDDSKCDQDLKPVSVATCNNWRCPIWTYGRWSECNDRCKKERTVVCEDHRGRYVDGCPLHLKPPSEENCCHIKWRSTWTGCSSTCGDGVRKREIVCMKIFKRSESNPFPRRTAVTIDSSYCRHMQKPKPQIMERPCRNKSNCKFRWKVGHWAKCSAGCGSGYTKRSVYCTNGTVTAPECDPKMKPMNSRKCESRSHCWWRTTKWRNCTCNGYTKRRVMCMDSLTNTPSNNCPEEEQPITKNRCNPPPNCSCKLMQMKRGIREDGEQLLNVRGRQVSIYCSNMSSVEPREYLTLRAGSKENYSIYYSKRARDSSRCGDRYNEVDDARMVGIFGTTRFERIRIDIHTLKVIEDDFTYATSYGKNQNFGTAGDCYGTTEDCPQGDFSINLTGTKFRIRPKTTWEVTGHHSSIQYVIRNQTGYQTVRARCGGNCGSCAPSRTTGLYLEVVT
ncbi:A disintegrin and metalloproteinase with thrombospondin motifs 15 [Culicoides brevitarsis]|uniref:A disintegrin and metalloproteinase with thrombospondin motifs 15 n=1 Tax=Culicoides brevitarsis TaxID=469753 RepID=UPI00307C55F8